MPLVLFGAFLTLIWKVTIARCEKIISGRRGPVAHLAYAFDRTDRLAVASDCRVQLWKARAEGEPVGLLL